MRKIPAVGILAALALAVVGCGGGEEGPAGTPTPGTPTVAPATARPSPVTSTLPVQTTATPLPEVDALPITKVAFVSRRHGAGEIYVLSPDGSQVNVSNDTAEDCDPDWSPDGEKIAFASDRSGDFNIYVVNADGTGLTRLTEGAAGDLSPRWSPDGKRIAFSRPGSLMVMDSDGANLAVVLQGKDEATASSLCETGGFVGGWSPDGTQIVYYAASPSKGIGHICIINVDGSKLRTVISEPPGYLVEPSWSADGRRIAYRSIREGQHEIYVVNLDGSGDTDITNDRATDLEPDWSPGDQWIVFASDRSGDFELYAIRPDGSGLLRLTASPGKDSDPSWSPR